MVDLTLKLRFAVECGLKEPPQKQALSHLVVRKYCADFAQNIMLTLFENIYCISMQMRLITAHKTAI